MGIDSVIFEIISGPAGRFFILDTVGVIFAKYIPYLMVVLFLFFLFLHDGWKRRLFIFLYASIGLLLSNGIVSKIIQVIYNRPRPFEVLEISPLIEHSPGFSFPSDHMTFFFTLALIVYLFNRKWGWWFISLSLLVGVARIFTGIHWPLDVFGGIAIGVVSAGTVYYLLKDQVRSIFNYG